MKQPLLWITGIFFSLTASASLAQTGPPEPGSVGHRVTEKSFPSVFQAWNPIDMPSWPQDSLEERLKAAAKHDLIWEEPVSQLGYGVKLVLGAVWDHKHGGLATGFTAESQQQAIANRAAMLKMNPDMAFLLEVRWRDAPGSFLPEDSPFWKRHPNGTRVEGWLGGPEPYFMLDYENEAFRANVSRQCRIALDSGVYDGIMLDWNGRLDLIKRVRTEIGQDGLIIVNIHDDVKDGEEYKDLINGSFMECNPNGPGAPKASFYTSWDDLRDGLIFFEEHFQNPQINCLEVWGSRDDLRRMRAATTLGLTHSNGYLLYADPNPLKTPDHLHNWYDFWNVDLGRPLNDCVRKKMPKNRVAERSFEGGVVVYNHFGNEKAVFSFDTPHKRLSDGKISKQFEMQDADGDIFLPATLKE
ncbi:hypothetical protein [Novipirellula artificiosorum]|uniref:Glycosyl hydrolase-like 10 domain-containing protein n=1 Tax=Novipirellula artificiosorum TaxID=2528016 RepID=A0A5C6DF17_9BACT|nr:hypothetical protein [Novipirellula artificiosorum]TWU34341.1 hypothetical protein Poly41_44880 [Novipirellula artificiosorum]